MESTVAPKITAKPLEWSQDYERQWNDKHHGFAVIFDPDEELPYSAACGEGDVENFATLEAAQAWCQEQIDALIAQHALVQPAAAAEVAVPASVPAPTRQELAAVPDSLARAGAHVLSEWLDDAAPLHERRYVEPARSAFAVMRRYASPQPAREPLTETERKDAERYRWLRKGAARTTGSPRPGRIEVFRWDNRAEGTQLKAEDLDAAVDTAIERAHGIGGKG